MIKGLTPYHILEKLTSQTKKEVKFAGSISKIFVIIRTLPGQSGENLNIWTFSHRKIKKGYASFVSYWILDGGEWRIVDRW